MEEIIWDDLHTLPIHDIATNLLEILDFTGIDAHKYEINLLILRLKILWPNFKKIKLNQKNIMNELRIIINTK